MGEARPGSLTADGAGRRFGVLSPSVASVLGTVVLVLVAVSIPLAGLVRQLTVPGEAAAVIPVLVSAAVGMVVAARLKDAVDLDSVRDDLAAVVHRTLEHVHVSVWLASRD